MSDLFNPNSARTVAEAAARSATSQDCIIYVVKIDKKDKPHENIQKKRSTILVPRPSLLFCILVKAERR